MTVIEMIAEFVRPGVKLRGITFNDNVESELIDFDPIVSVETNSNDEWIHIHTASGMTHNVLPLESVFVAR